MYENLPSQHMTAERRQTDVAEAVGLLYRLDGNVNPAIMRSCQMAPRRRLRRDILDAASELARTQGAAHLSLDAVAARAGVSKGGLLYHFPTKSALLKGLVEQYMQEFKAALENKSAGGDAGQLAPVYLDLAVTEIRDALPPPSGLLAALAEDPELLAPVRAFNRDLLDRMKSGTSDDTAVLILFLVLEGLRCQKTLGTDVLRPEEQARVLNSLSTMLKPS